MFNPTGDSALWRCQWRLSLVKMFDITLAMDLLCCEVVRDVRTFDTHTTYARMRHV